MFHRATSLYLTITRLSAKEIRDRCPEVTVLDQPVEEFREFLLTSPRLEVSVVTPESRARTTTTKAMLQRKALKESLDPQAFLQSLDVQLKVWAGARNDLSRAAELLRRTNQFTTTGLRLTEADLATHESSLEVWLLSVRDTFADYGTVGVCLLDGEEVVAVAVSCRVISLDVGLPFLVGTLCAADRLHPGIRGLVKPTAANQPARDLFLQAGFESVGGGVHVLADLTRVPTLDKFPHRLSIAAQTPIAPTVTEASSQ